jgi:phosphomannomutase
MTIKQIATAGHNNAVKNGFYFNDSEQAIKDKLDEEIEELKTAIYCKDYKSFPNIKGVDDDSFIFMFERFIKNTVGGELSDIIITALSGAVELGIPIELFIEAGIRYNSLRRY